MLNPTRLSMKFTRWQTNIVTQSKHTQQSFTRDLFCLVIGFFFGSVFGTVLSTLRKIIPWDFFTILGIIFLAEFVNAKTYNRTHRQFAVIEPRVSYWRAANLLKLGGLFAFCVEAFKIGS